MDITGNTTAQWQLPIVLSLGKTNKQKETKKTPKLHSRYIERKKKKKKKTIQKKPTP